MEEKNIGRKLPNDEELEKLFEGMSRETAREIANQHTPTKRATKKKVVYIEPADYIPEDIRRELKLGEFAEPKEDEKKPSPADYDRWGKVGVKFTN